MIRRRQPRRLASGSVWDRLDLGDTAVTRWMRDALCAQTDPDAFFPVKGEPTGPAKRVCQACPVAAECLAYALAHGERFGVWGATSDRQRTALRRQPAGQVA
ncbi:WhiB family transcriptional regulator [Actinophytocola sp.]|uniref:WhiB family transcriptional regulator n=1 Tax=Actinophytocola sp. TaxID=1872138 RepID=UPI0039C87CDB